MSRSLVKNRTASSESRGRLGRLALATLMLLGWALILPASARAQTTEPDEPLSPELVALLKVKWTSGPAKVQLGSVASLNLPAGYRFAGDAGTRALQAAFHNPSSGNELGVVLPAEGYDWFLIFSYSDEGYVKDDEKSALDKDATDKMLESIRQSTEEGNRQRALHGWSPIRIDGWQQAPFYDDQSKHLTWALRVSSTEKNATESNINYESRLLGRAGVISANMITSPEQLASLVPTYRTLCGNVTFNPGQRYEEYRSGDKIARYGLIGLVTGGAAVAVVKGWKVFSILGAKILGVIGVAFAAAFKKIKGLFSRRTSAA